MCIALMASLGMQKRTRLSLERIHILTLTGNTVHKKVQQMREEKSVGSDTYQVMETSSFSSNPIRMTTSSHLKM